MSATFRTMVARSLTKPMTAGQRYDDSSVSVSVNLNRKATTVNTRLRHINTCLLEYMWLEMRWGKCWEETRAHEGAMQASVS